MGIIESLSFRIAQLDSLVQSYKKKYFELRDDTGWVDMKTKWPPYNTPLALKVDGTLQAILYRFNENEGGFCWFEGDVFLSSHEVSTDKIIEYSSKSTVEWRLLEDGGTPPEKENTCHGLPKVSTPHPMPDVKPPHNPDPDLEDLLSYVKVWGGVKTKDVAFEFGLTRQQAYRFLNKLTKEGIIYKKIEYATTPEEKSIFGEKWAIWRAYEYEPVSSV